jgi:hypothetical protein
MTSGGNLCRLKLIGCMDTPRNVPQTNLEPDNC